MMSYPGEWDNAGVHVKGSATSFEMVYEMATSRPVSI